MAETKKNEGFSLEKTRNAIEASKKRRQITKNALKFIGLCVALMLVVVIYQNRSDLTWAGFTNWISDRAALMGIGSGFPVNITGGSTKSIDSFGNAIIELTDTSFVVLDSTGKEAANRQHGFSSPAISVTDRYALLYDMGGTNYRIESISKTVHTSSSENQILDASLSKSGKYALITKDNSYLGALYVYGKNHEPVFIWKSANYQLNSTSVSPNGKYTAVTGVNTENGRIKSCLLVFDYYKEKPIVKCEFLDNLILSVDFTSSSKVTVVGDSAAYVVKVSDGTTTEIDYDGKSLAGYDCDYNYGTALLLSKFSDLHNCNLLFYDENGEKQSETETALYGGFVLLKGRRAYFISGNQLFEYSSKGEIKNQLDIGSNIKQCAVLGNSAYLLGTSKIDKLGL